MEPSFKNGAKVLVSFLPYLFYRPNINDIIVFKTDNKFFIKRIIEKKDNWFSVEGDNKKDSMDSKNFGKISYDQIVAKVIYKL